jgi:hypothetical protein
MKSIWKQPIMLVNVLYSLNKTSQTFENEICFPLTQIESALLYFQVEDSALRDQIEQYNRRLRDFEERQRQYREEQERQAEAEAEVVQALLRISEHNNNNDNTNNNNGSKS